MNIFKEYKNKILNTIKKAEKDKILILPENLNSINVDSTPPKIDFDLSTNVSMVLSKPNNKSPNVIADIIIDLLKKDDHNIDQKEYKWGSETTLRTIELSEMPDYLSENYKKYTNWLEI